MKIIIYQNREVYKEESKIGNDSENKVETLEFEFPEEYKDFTKYIEFQIKGGKYVDLIEDNKYVITREVAKYGKIKTQVVLKKNTENDVIIFKSDIFTLTVSNSINATENLVNTVGVDFIEKILNDVKNKEDKIPGKGLSTNDFTDEYKNKIDKLNESGGVGGTVDLSNVTHKYFLAITTTITAGKEITLPCYYKVGADVLDVYLNGEKLLLSSDDSGTDGHYREVGTSGSVSNIIKTTTDWNLESGDVLGLEVRGEYTDET